MKNPTPIQIAQLTSIIISLILLVVLIAVKLFILEHFLWLLVFLIPFFVLVITYIVCYYTIEIFIYRKIKLIYKTIYDTKSPQMKRAEKINLSDDIIREVESEVDEWSKTQTKEILRQKKLESYRKEFLGNVFHELKTPIFNIHGYLETLIEGGIGDANINERFLHQASKNVDRMIEIVDDLQMIANLEDGSFSLSMEKFNIYKLASEILENFELLASKRNITLGFKEGCEESFHVLGDRSMIQQVLTNLITNSIKYGKESGKTQVGLYDMNENILIEVSDNGIGIGQIHLPRIFERFYRVNKDRSREQGGSGLGLSIVKHIIEAHNQTVNVRSAPDVGSTFGFTLKKVRTS